jgi:hypothetical protein
VEEEESIGGREKRRTSVIEKGEREESRRRRSREGRGRGGEDKGTSQGGVGKERVCGAAEKGRGEG